MELTEIPEAGLTITGLLVFRRNTAEAMSDFVRKINNSYESGSSSSESVSLI